MLNPDGVVNGNYRSSLAGEDLNRRYANPSMGVSPEVAAIKRLLEVRSAGFAGESEARA